MNQFYENVDRIKRDSEKSNKMVNLISDVSDQINLLSLNASIEAARAGESGKGFTVVANEIKKLAQQSKRATDDIRKIISKTTDETTKGFVEIIELSDKVGTLSAEIRQLPTRFHEINRSVSEVSQFMDEFSNTLDRVSQDTEHIQSRRYEQQTTFKEMSKRMGDVYNNMKNNLDSIFDMGEKITAMKKQNEHLQKSIEKFKTADRV
ncbi:methyl-accepting chemotaxis protein [Bacillus weihaiensis]|uniref:methyl-accepting chemotaxis protein n=1 Tax=Bacillus weihaiensis TaxID=1547283 RepID=UPI003F6D16B7